MDTDNILLKIASSAPKWTEVQEKEILTPFNYLLDRPGKEFRKRLLEAFNQIIGCPQEYLEKIEKIVEMLHVASLLTDDVEDHATLRRGVPAAHCVFGVAPTINAANYVYFVSMKAVVDGLCGGGDDTCVNIFMDEMINLHRGQGMDLYWRDNLVCPTEDEYLDMVMNKTGGLFRMAVRFLQAKSDYKGDLVPLTNLFGILYQISDDYQNLQSDVYTSNKGFCEDLTEGKFSFPVIHAIKADASNTQIIDVLKLHTEDKEVKQNALEYMRNQTKSFQYTESVLRQLQKLAVELVQNLDEDPEAKASLLKTISVVSRS